MHYIAKVLIFIGLAVAFIGILVYFFGDRLSWIGHLPGDIRIEKQNMKFYFPITTMLIISIIVTVIIKFIQKILQ